MNRVALPLPVAPAALTVHHSVETTTTIRTFRVNHVSKAPILDTEADQHEESAQGNIHEYDRMQKLKRLRCKVRVSFCASFVLTLAAIVWLVIYQLSKTAASSERNENETLLLE